MRKRLIEWKNSGAFIERGGLWVLTCEGSVVLLRYWLVDTLVDGKDTVLTVVLDEIFRHHDEIADKC